MPKYRHVWRTLPVRAACSSARVLRRISCCALDTVSLLPGRTQVSNEVGNVYTRARAGWDHVRRRQAARDNGSPFERTGCLSRVSDRSDLVEDADRVSESVLRL